MKFRKLFASLALVSALALGGLSVSGGGALADPDFGPGNSSKGPHDPGAKCHPPGQTEGDPGCKEDGELSVSGREAGMSDGGLAHPNGWSWNG